MIVDPITAAAARGGAIDIDVAGETSLRGQIVGTLQRFPTAGTRFIVTAERRCSGRWTRTAGLGHARRDLARRRRPGRPGVRARRTTASC